MNNEKKFIQEEKELEALLRRDLCVYFTIFDLNKDKQLEFLQMISRVFQNIYISYLSEPEESDE